MGSLSPSFCLVSSQLEWREAAWALIMGTPRAAMLNFLPPNQIQLVAGWSPTGDLLHTQSGGLPPTPEPPMKLNKSMAVCPSLLGCGCNSNEGEALQMGFADYVNDNKEK